MKLRMFVVGVLLFAVTVPTMAVLADGNGPPPEPPGTQDPGIDRYNAVTSIADIPQLAQNGTSASSCSCGYFGKDWNLGNETSGHYVGSHGWDGTPGANGYQTGVNNSGVAGNRQGNLP